MDHPNQVLDQTTNCPKQIAQTVFYLQKWQGPSKEICSNRWNVHLDSNRQPTLWALYSTKQVAVESKYRTKLLPLEAAKTVQTKFRRTLLDQKCSLETEVGATCRKCSIHGLPVQHAWLRKTIGYFDVYCDCITVLRTHGGVRDCQKCVHKTIGNLKQLPCPLHLQSPTWNRRNYAAKKYGLFCSE